MPQLRWSISYLFAFSALVAVGLTLLKPLMQEGSNCGGNSAALSAVKQYALIVELANEQASEAALNVATATDWQRRELGHIVQAHPYAHFLVSPESFASQRSGPRRVITVCDRAFTNVPRYSIGRAPPTHAAAFSDGTTGLISVAEFQAISRSSLTSLDRLLGPGGFADNVTAQ